MSAVGTDPHTLCPHCRGQRCDSGNGVRRRLFGSSSPQSSAEETTCRSPILPATTLDLSRDRSRSPSDDGRPSGHSDQSSSRPADLPSPFDVADARCAPPDPATAQALRPLGLEGLERKTAPLALKRQVLPARPPAAAVVPVLAPQRSPVRPCSCYAPGFPCAPTSFCAPGALQKFLLQPTCAPAFPGSCLVACSSRGSNASAQAFTGSSGLAAPAWSYARSAPTRSSSPSTHASTSQCAAQEAPKLAHGCSQAPQGSPSRPRVPARVPTAHDVPVARPVPVIKAPLATLQHTPERPHPTARPARPPQQRTPVWPHPDARPEASMPVLSDQRLPTRQRAIPSSRYLEPVLSRPRPVLLDTCSGAPVLSRPPVPHQDAARPRIRLPPVPAPARHMPSPSPTRDRAHAAAPAPARHRSHAPVTSRPPHCPLSPAPPPSLARPTALSRPPHRPLSPAPPPSLALPTALSRPR
ncbi:uncharacterized protein [Palaemon carinicauda]|uniref:uncharacterized protein n=1 Tax=Palaemon carinicauda TaxID=392227 RepID=UPI0035B5EFBB